jgi:hypothetical protein
LPFCAVAQEDADGASFQRSLEMPAHRSLQSIISDSETTLAPFETDGCSGGMSWSWRLVSDVFEDFAEAQGTIPPWEHCCVIHDRAYHSAGGAQTAGDSYAARLAADEALRLCVVDQGQMQVTQLSQRYDVPPERIEQAYGLIGDAMFSAVRLGGAPCSILPWRWGFGYPLCQQVFQ